MIKTDEKRHQTTNLTNLLEGDGPPSSDPQKLMKSEKKRLQNLIFIVWYLWNRQLRLQECYQGLFIRPAAKTTRIRSHVDNWRSQVLKKTRLVPF